MSDYNSDILVVICLLAAIAAELVFVIIFLDGIIRELKKKRGEK